MASVDIHNWLNYTHDRSRISADANVTRHSGQGCMNAVMISATVRILAPVVLGVALVATIGHWSSLSSGPSTVHAQQDPVRRFTSPAADDQGSSKVSAQVQPDGEAVRRCIQNALGRLPITLQEISEQEQAKLSQACPEAEGRLGVLFFGPIPSSEAQMREQQRAIDESLRTLEQRTRAAVLQETARMNREIADRERRIRDNLQQELDRLEQSRTKFQSELQALSGQIQPGDRQAAAARQDLNRQLSQLDRERSNLEQSTENQIQRDRVAFEQEIATRELEITKLMEQAGPRLELRRSELEKRILEIQTEKVEERRRLTPSPNESSGQDRSGPSGPSDPNAGGGQSSGLPVRGFFSNSAANEVSDIDKLVDPTTLAVLGILLTLVPPPSPWSRATNGGPCFSQLQLNASDQLAHAPIPCWDRGGTTFGIDHQKSIDK